MAVRQTQARRSLPASLVCSLPHSPRSLLCWAQPGFSFEGKQQLPGWRELPYRSLESPEPLSILHLLCHSSCLRSDMWLFTLLKWVPFLIFDTPTEMPAEYVGKKGSDTSKWQFSSQINTSFTNEGTSEMSSGISPPFHASPAGWSKPGYSTLQGSLVVWTLVPTRPPSDLPLWKFLSSSLPRQVRWFGTGRKHRCTSQC